MHIVQCTMPKPKYVLDCSPKVLDNIEISLSNNVFICKLQFDIIL